MVEPRESADPAPPGPSLAETWQDQPAVRLALFGAAFAAGLVAIDAARPPRADDLRFAWLAAVPFALAFVVRHALWPVAAAVAYQVGTWAPNAVYDRPLPTLGDLQPLFPAMTALAGMGIVWTAWGFRAGYDEPPAPPVFGRAPVRRMRLRLAAAVLLYALGCAPLLLDRAAGRAGPTLAWLALAPFALAPLARGRLWPFAAGLVAGAVAAVLMTDAWPQTAAFGAPIDWRWPAVAGAAAFAGSLAWAMAGAGFLAAAAVERLAARWRGR